MIVEIHWLDSIGTEGWQRPDCLDEVRMEVRTVGYLIKETEDAYIVTHSALFENNDAYAPLKIPKVAVTGVWELTV